MHAINLCEFYDIYYRVKINIHEYCKLLVLFNKNTNFKTTILWKKTKFYSKQL